MCVCVWAASPGRRVICNFWGRICVASAAAVEARSLRGRSSFTCSRLDGNSRAFVLHPAATRFSLRSQRDKLAVPWPKSCHSGARESEDCHQGGFSLTSKEKIINDRRQANARVQSTISIDFFFFISPQWQSYILVIVMFCFWGGWVILIFRKLSQRTLENTHQSVVSSLPIRACSAQLGEKSAAFSHRDSDCTVTQKNTSMVRLYQKAQVSLGIPRTSSPQQKATYFC